jgi:hypothetical protein
MPGDIGGEPSYKDRVTAHRERREKRAEQNTDTTLTLDGAEAIYGDGPPVTKDDSGGQGGAGAAEVAAGVSAGENPYADDHPALAADELAKSASGRSEKPLSVEDVREHLHDAGLSTKQAVLEVRDELRRLRGEGSAGDSGSVVKDTENETTTNTSTDTDATGGQRARVGTGLDIDAVPGLDTESTDKGTSSNGDDPAPTTVDELAEDGDLMDTLGVRKDAEGQPRYPALARYKLAVATAKARAGENTV